MKKSWLVGIAVIIGILGLAIILSKVPLLDVILSYRHASLKYIIGFILMSVVMHSAVTYRWHIINRSMNIRISFFRTVLYRLAGWGVSFFTPAAKLGGEPLRAALLKKHDVDFPKALSSVVIDKSIDVSSAILFFAIGAVILIANAALPDNARFMLILIAMFAFLAVGYFYYNTLKGNNILGKLIRFLRLDRIKKIRQSERKLEKFEQNVISFYKHDKKTFLGAILVTALSWAGMFFEYKFALLLIGFDATPLQIFMVFSFVGAAYVFPIPMAVGSLEAGQVSVFAILGMKSAVGVALSLLIRTRDTLIALSGLVLLSYFGLNVPNVFKKLFKSQNQDDKNNSSK